MWHCVTRMTSVSVWQPGCDEPRDFLLLFTHLFTRWRLWSIRSPWSWQTRYSGLLPGLTSSPLTALVHWHCAESARVDRIFVQSPSSTLGNSCLGRAMASVEWRGSVLGEVRCRVGALCPSRANRRWPSDSGVHKRGPLGELRPHSGLSLQDLFLNLSLHADCHTGVGTRIWLSHRVPKTADCWAEVTLWRDFGAKVDFLGAEKQVF